MRALSFTSLMTLILSNGAANAHGEAKPGPHGGYIQMPGAFHTEIVQLGPNKLQVFLLDINFENPSTKNSAITIIHKAESSTKAKCEAKENTYICVVPKEIDLSRRGELVVTSQRESKTGRDVTYVLPLKH